MRPVKTKKTTRRPRQVFRKRFCRLCKEKISYVDYKDAKRLERFLNDRGKIFSRRYSGNCARHQRMVARAIKQARFASILPYTK